MSFEVARPTLDDVREALALPNFNPARAQLHMAPLYRPLRRPDSVPGQPHVGSVLVLLYPLNGALTFVLTRRTEAVATHKGQISFPGGMQERGEMLEQTAIRETCEELHVYLKEDILLGHLTELYIPPSDFEVHPFVAYMPERPAFRPDPIEVAEVLELSLPTLLDDSIKAREVWTIRGQEVEVPFYRVGGYAVWGATAIMLSEFEHRLRAVLQL
jgi:8-oxo-dGTP pyrophosphatase MutT (NUDIX family)